MLNVYDKKIYIYTLSMIYSYFICICIKAFDTIHSDNWWEDIISVPPDKILPEKVPPKK